jgi:hypothetical protein
MELWEQQKEDKIDAAVIVKSNSTDSKNSVRVKAAPAPAPAAASPDPKNSVRGKPEAKPEAKPKKDAKKDSKKEPKPAKRTSNELKRTEDSASSVRGKGSGRATVHFGAVQASPKLKHEPQPEMYPNVTGSFLLLFRV